MDKKGKANKIIVIATILAALTAAITLAFVYGIEPALQDAFPDDLAVIITISSIYFIGLGLLEAFALEPLLEKWLKLGAISTNSKSNAL